MTMTWSVLASSSDRAEATTRLFTLVRRSTSLDRPPKNSGRPSPRPGLPPAEGHVQGQGGKGAAPAGVCPWQPKPMERGGRHAVGALHLADLIQDGELFPVGVPEGPVSQIRR